MGLVEKCQNSTRLRKKIGIKYYQTCQSYLKQLANPNTLLQSDWYFQSLPLPLGKLALVNGGHFICMQLQSFLPSVRYITELWEVSKSVIVNPGCIWH